MFNKEILKTVTVLYVEDDESIQTPTKEILQRVVKEVYTASNGQEGLNLFAKLRNEKINIDIVITDINMPKMSGLSMMRSIRSLDKYIPFILTTAHAEEEYFLDAISLGVTYYAIKPVVMKDLLLQVELICKTKYQELVIENKYKENEQYLDIINKVAIVSKTDFKGNITFANNVFSEVSGYTSDELIGQNQRIVRHPDMPKKIFDSLWNTLREGKSWHGKIKNKAKDGSSYFVNANIFPIHDDTGNDIIEYMAVRFLITSEEEKRREFKKNVIQNIKLQKEKEHKLKNEIKDLEKKLKYATFNDIDLVQNALKKEKEKVSKVKNQLGYYENELKSHDFKINKVKVDLNKKIETLFEENRELKTLTEVAKDKVLTMQNELTAQTKENKKLHDMIKNQVKMIKDLKDVIEHREEQLKEK